MVAVGATMVGKVRVRFDPDLTTNSGRREPAERFYPPGAASFARGEEWGHFEFGSTIVLVAAPGVVRLEASSPGTLLRLRTRIGALCPAAAELSSAPSIPG